jgi:BASS family bile acid:Na+ symporter
MDGIDRAEFQFDPRFGIVVGILVAIMVFAIALDLRWEHFKRILRSPRPIVVGMVAQLAFMPALAFLVARAMVHTPSVALGLLLVACCPGGAVSTYLTGVARGDVATSVTLSTLNTVTSIVTLPLIFGLWASANPTTAGLLREVGVDPVKLVMMFVVTVALPILAGMLLHARRPDLADRIRVWVRRVAAILFAIVVVTGVSTNIRLLLDFAREAALPTFLCCAGSTALGWGLGWVTRVIEPDRRAVAIEVGGQNVALAIGMALAFFPSHVGVAVMGAVWSVVQISLLVSLALIWRSTPPRALAEVSTAT